LRTSKHSTGIWHFADRIDEDDQRRLADKIIHRDA